MISLSDLSILALNQLQAKAVIGTEAEIIGFVVTSFKRQAICVMLVGRKAGPAALANCEQFRDQKTANFVTIFRAENMLDFSVGLCLV